MKRTLATGAASAGIYGFAVPAATVSAHGSDRLST